LFDAFLDKFYIWDIIYNKLVINSVPIGVFMVFIELFGSQILNNYLKKLSADLLLKQKALFYFAKDV